jgi:hypothetical protein
MRSLNIIYAMRSLNITGRKILGWQGVAKKPSPLSWVRSRFLQAESLNLRIHPDASPRAEFKGAVQRIRATDALMGAAYGSAGERCVAVSVAVAVGGAGDRLMDKLVPRVRALKIGPGTDPQAGSTPCSATWRCTAWKACASTPASKP